MSELVTRVAENVGIDAATAEKAVGMILGFLQREAAEGPVARMILGMGEITGLARETIAYAKERAGEEVVDEVVASVPGLSQFV